MPYQKVSFHIVAHVDDWMLFCGEQVYKDLNDPNTKTVFINVCACNGGPGPVGIKQSQAFEAGLFDTLDAIKGAGRINHEVNILDHIVAKYTFGLNENSVAYFLHIPDGPYNDDNYKCLEVLSGNPKYPPELAKWPVKTIDEKSTYNNWQEFVSVLTEIIRQESIQGAVWRVFAPDNDETEVHNGNDHQDHLCVAEAVQGSLRGLPIEYKQYLWIGYSTATRAGEAKPTPPPEGPPYILDLKNTLEFNNKALFFWQWVTWTNQRMWQNYLDPYPYFAAVWLNWGPFSGVSKIIPPGTLFY